MKVDEEYIVVCEAIMKAKEKFYEVIEDKYDYDGVFYPIDIKVIVLGVDFKPLYEVSLKDVVSE